MDHDSHCITAVYAHRALRVPVHDLVPRLLSRGCAEEVDGAERRTEGLCLRRAPVGAAGPPAPAGREGAGVHCTPRTTLLKTPAFTTRIRTTFPCELTFKDIPLGLDKLSASVVLTEYGLVLVVRSIIVGLVLPGLIGNFQTPTA